MPDTSQTDTTRSLQLIVRAHRRKRGEPLDAYRRRLLKDKLIGKGTTVVDLMAVERAE